MKWIAQGILREQRDSLLESRAAASVYNRRVYGNASEKRYFRLASRGLLADSFQLF
jgi:hypothetical protein